MLSRDRRLGFRVPLEIFLNQYIDDRLFRGLTCDISDTGLRLHTVTAARGRFLGHRSPVGIELELPGTGEIIWARGEVCHARDEHYQTLSCGIRFTAMPRVHARLIRDFCIETRREHYRALLERIRRPSLA